jgi:hypothetical protein
MESEVNIGRSTDSLMEATRLLKQQAMRLMEEQVQQATRLPKEDATRLQNIKFLWVKYVEALVELGLTHEVAARDSTDKQIHLERAQKVFEDAVAVADERGMKQLQATASEHLKAIVKFLAKPPQVVN